MFVKANEGEVPRKTLRALTLHATVNKGDQGKLDLCDVPSAKTFRWYSSPNRLLHTLREWNIFL